MPVAYRAKDYPTLGWIKKWILQWKPGIGGGIQTVATFIPPIGFMFLALAILEDFYDFCRRMQVRGQVTFTGGNPLLYPHIEPVYRAAADLGFGIAVLGNPGPIDPIRRLMEIAPPLAN